MISPAATAAAAIATEDGRPADRASLAANFDSFLRLLTTQLEHQDPLSPLDAGAFVTQLVQFASVEQAIKTNQNLDRLAALVRTEQIGAAVNYLGAEVEAAGNAVRLGPSGGADLAYRLGDAAAEVTITVTDAGGRTVYSAAGSGTAAGAHRFVWEGRDAGGRRAPEGLYRIDVAAIAADGGTVAATTTVRGTVDGVELDADGMTLSVNGVAVPLDAVTAVRRPADD